MHWLATALSCSTSLLCFAAGTSLCAVDSSMTAYDCHWTGHGLVTPSMCTADSYRALEWAIASAYPSEPTRLLLLCHSPNNAACINKLMLHPLVYRLASAPPGSMPVSTHVGFTQHMQCTWPSTNSSQMALVLIANAAGLGSLSIAWEQVQQAIRHCGLDVCQTSRAVPRVGPLPRPVSVLKSAKTHQPSPREATCSPDPDCAVLELIIAKPAKRWAGVPAVYTDGSKRDSSLSFAWTSPVMSLEKQYTVPGPASCHRTVLQAELMAIHAAIHAEELQGVQAIMTDSLNFIYLVAAHIACPESLRYHKHSQLITEISLKLLTWPSPISLIKVRSHSNVSGNHAADSLAAAAHTDATPSYPFCLTQPRGRAWVQVPFGDTYSDAYDLGPHLVKCARSAYAEFCMNEHNMSKTKALKQICKAVANSPGGLHVQASTAFWNHKGLSDWDISLTLQARFWSLHTGAFLAKWHAVESEVCSLCGLTSDTVPHRLGGCTSSHQFTGETQTWVHGGPDCPHGCNGEAWGLLHVA